MLSLPLPRPRPLSLPQGHAGFLCFTFSAVFHELVVALPLGTTRMPLAFFGMMAQVPADPLAHHVARARDLRT